MSQLRSEETFSPEQIGSYPESGSISNLSEEPNNSQLLQGKSETCQLACSPSPQLSFSSGDFPNPYDAVTASSGSGSVVDDTDDFSSSFSSSQYNIVNSESSSGSIVRDSSWKSVTTGSEDLISDVSCSNLSTSGSETDGNNLPFDNQEEEISFDKYRDNCSSDGFETENSEEGSHSTAVRIFRKFASQSNSGKASRSRKTKSVLIQSQTQEGTSNNGFSNTSQNQERRRHFNRGIKTIVRRIDSIIYRMTVRAARYHKELCIVFLVLASCFASLRSA